MQRPVSVQAKRVYDAILDFERSVGRRPSQQEVAVAAGYKSKGSANKYIKELERAGWLTRDYWGLSTLRPTG